MGQHRFTPQEAKEAGAKKGIHNKTKQWELLGKEIIGRHADRFNSVLDNLDDLEFVISYISILGYFKPKLAASSVDLTMEGDSPTFIALTQEQIDKFVAEL